MPSPDEPIGRFAALRAAARAFAEAGLAFDAIAGEVVRRLAETIGESVVLRTVSADGRWLEPVAFYHVDPGAHARLREVLRADAMASDTLTARVARTARTHSLADVPEKDLGALLTSPAYAGFVSRFDTRTTVIAPLVSRGRVIGTLGVSRGGAASPFDDGECELVEAVAEITAVALDNARLHAAAEEERRRVERLVRAQADVARAVAEAGLDFGRIADVVADCVTRLVGDGCVIRAHAGEGPAMRVVAARHVDPEMETVLRGLPDADVASVPPYSDAIEGGRTVVITNLGGDTLKERTPPEAWPVVARHAARTVMAVPLTVGARVVGVVAVGRRDPPPFTDDERALVEALAWHAARGLERARVFAETEEARAWLEAVMDRAPIPMFLVHPVTARVTFANRAAHALAGGRFPADFDALQAEGFRFYDEQGRALRDEDTPRARVVRGETLAGLPLEWQTPVGRHHLLVHADLVSGPDGRSSAGVVIFQDLTDQKRAEARLREADRVKDEFLATLSHELRTPLNAILGWAHILRERHADPAIAARAVDTIVRNANAQARLVSDILDISRIVAGRMRLNVRITALEGVVQAALDAIAPAAEAKGIRTRATVDPAAGVVSGDPDRLQQVVWNLLSNAVKFTPRGGTVQVRVMAVESHVEIQVEDSGPGIDPAFLPHVFERFRQADGSITRRHGGVGLGLAIVRHLVELHGGDVSAGSGASGGALLTIRLPRPDAALLAAAPAPAPAPAAEPAVPTTLEGVRVLVVDDDADGRDMAAFVLGCEGALVFTAGTAEEALRLVEAEPPDVLLADIEMPGVDGYELLRRVRALPEARGGRTPAAALTAYAASIDRVKALSAGFQLHVPKPVEPTELVAVVASLAARR